MARDLKRLEVDDSSPQAIIEQIVARIYRISTLLERYVPIEDIGDDSISVGKALNIDAAMGDKKFEESIKAEVLDNLITKTGTLEAISRAEVNALQNHTFIHTVVKCKRKQNSDGTYDKHKARTAARGDEYLRKLLARGQQPPASFSPTINALTFQFVLQVATSKSLHRATQDIKYAYLNAPLPEDMEPIITKLDDNIADICGLPRGQLYRIRKALYGLPASGRLWYEHYTDSLKKEGYMQSKFDPCLFYRINESEVTYVHLLIRRRHIRLQQQTGAHGRLRIAHAKVLPGNPRHQGRLVPWHPVHSTDRRIHYSYPAEAIEQTPQGIPIPRPEVHPGPPLRPYAQSRPTSYWLFTSGESV
jgi:hypothetical protein